MGDTEKVQYDYKGRIEEFVIHKLSFGQYQKVLQSVSSVEMIGGVIRSKNVDYIRVMDEMMKVAVSCGEGVDFHELDMQSGMDLQARVLKLNGMGDEGPFPAAS